MTDTPAAQRTRTISWEDPQMAAQAAPAMAGLDYLHAIRRGELPPPPIMTLMNMGMVSAEQGRVVFSVEPAEYHYNPIGTVHGGMACTICDSALGCAVHSTLPAGVGYTTLELKVNFVRPITTATGRLLCEGKIIHSGSRVATAEARLTDERGKLYAHATTTCIVLRSSARE
jgi:uncharacterized protein (TIGR00369 family)